MNKEINSMGEQQEDLDSSPSSVHNYPGGNIYKSFQVSISLLENEQYLFAQHNSGLWAASYLMYIETI